VLVVKLRSSGTGAARSIESLPVNPVNNEGSVRRSQAPANYEPWAATARPPALTGNEVHVWRATLARPAARVAELYALLSSEERNRAARFRFRRDQEQFIVARGVLRQLLGTYLDRPPADLTFAYSAYGKPALGGEAGPHPLRFNLAHSHALALYAFALGFEVGVDLEYIRADFGGERIAERFFSAREVTTLLTIDASSQTEAFFNCWTRKEAYIKALGEGLSHPLDSFTVSMRPGEPAALLSVEGGEGELTRWLLRELDAAPGYAAALVVERRDWELTCFEWA